MSLAIATFGPKLDFESPLQTDKLTRFGGILLAIGALDCVKFRGEFYKDQGYRLRQATAAALPISVTSPHEAVSPGLARKMTIRGMRLRPSTDRWNHSQGSGREVIRIPIEKGRATGVYQDFLTGFTTDGNAWGRPLGVAVASDGSLLVSHGGARVIWRVSYRGK